MFMVRSSFSLLIFVNVDDFVCIVVLSVFESKGKAPLRADNLRIDTISIRILRLWIVLKCVILWSKYYRRFTPISSIVTFFSGFDRVYVQLLNQMTALTEMNEILQRTYKSASANRKQLINPYRGFVLLFFNYYFSPLHFPVFRSAVCRQMQSGWTVLSRGRHLSSRSNQRAGL